MTDIRNNPQKDADDDDRTRAAWSRPSSWPRSWQGRLHPLAHHRRRPRRTCPGDGAMTAYSRSQRHQAHYILRLWAWGWTVEIPQNRCYRTRNRRTN